MIARIKGTTLGNLGCARFVQRSNGSYFRAEEADVKHFLCVAQCRQFIDKTTTYLPVSETVSGAVSHMVRTLGGHARRTRIARR
ncbi:hypothetical protein [Burkholderia sp. PU8-34]